MQVRAKRSGWNETLTPEQEFDFDPYEYEDDDLEGELEVIAVPASRETPALKVHLVGGQEADPKTIEELDAIEECAAPDCEDDCDGDDCPTPLLEDAAILDVPDSRQSENWSCGSACVAAVARFYSVEPDTEGEAIRALGSSPRDGTDPERMIAVLEDHGLSTTALAGMDLDQLEWFVSRGRPVIVACQAYGTPEEVAALEAGHYVVVLSVTTDAIVVMDPARFTPEDLAGYGESLGGQRVAIGRDEFVRRWIDVDSEGAEYKKYGIAIREPSA